jgi:hypothetical protein
MLLQAKRCAPYVSAGALGRETRAMPKVMLSFRDDTAPSLEQIKQRLGLSDEEIDLQFGLIEIDPDAHEYTILVEDSAAARITGRPEWKGGAFSNPKIAPFGPPAGTRKS